MVLMSVTVAQLGLFMFMGVDAMVEAMVMHVVLRMSLTGWTMVAVGTLMTQAVALNLFLATPYAEKAVLSECR